MKIVEQVAEPGRVAIRMQWNSIEGQSSVSVENFLEILQGNINIAFPGVSHSQVLVELNRVENQPYDVELKVSRANRNRSFIDRHMTP